MILIKPLGRLYRLKALAYAPIWVILAASAQPAPQSLPITPLAAGPHVIQAEVARSAEERAVGLMSRPKLAENSGMLFVFEDVANQCFWMKNTLVPLSIAFLKSDGTIVEVADMAPQSLDQHCSKDEVRFALEVSEGWFSNHGIKPGDRLSGKPFAPAEVARPESASEPAAGSAVSAASAAIPVVPAPPAEAPASTAASSGSAAKAPHPAASHAS